MPAIPHRFCPEGHGVPAGVDTCPTCNTMLGPTRVEASAADVSFLAKHYDLRGKLGEGGMGVVYRVWNRDLQREEAVKQVRQRAFLDSEQRSRFRKEAEAVARLKHTNIVQVYAVGDAEGSPYFAMELVEGGSLATRARREPIGFRDAASLVATLARAIHFAHQRRIVHLDLKPENVLLTESGEPKISDFGLAQQLPPNDAVALPGMAGTPGYMAPEQFAEGEATAGPPADVFGLGAVLYRLLAGRPPFTASEDTAAGGNTVHDLRRSLVRAYANPPSPLRSLRPEVPPELQAICDKCLRHDPQQRYASAADLADDLSRFLRKEPTDAYPLTRLQKLDLWRRRHPAIAFLALLLVGATLVGLSSTSYFAWDAYGQADLARKAADDAKKKAEEANAESKARLEQKRESDRRGYLANLRLVQMAWESSQPDRLRPLLEQQMPKQADDVDLRGFEWYFWTGVVDSSREFPVGNMCQGVAVSPKGDRVAAACMMHVWFRDEISGKESRLNASAWTVAFHPDAKMLIAGGEGEVSLWDLDQGKRIETIPARTPGKAWMRAVAFSADGKRIGWGDGSDVFVRDIKDGEPVKLRSPGDIGFLQFSADGKGLAIGGDDGIDLWDYPTLKQRKPISKESCKFLAFSPQSDRLVASGKQVTLFDLKAGSSRTLPQPDEPVDGVAFSPDGKTIAAACYDRVVRLWDSARGNEKATLRGHTRRVTSVAFTPDGKHLVSGGMDDVVRHWSVTQEPGSLPLEPIPHRGGQVAFLPKSGRLVRAGEDLTAYDVRTGKIAWSVVPPVYNLQSIAVSSDGTRILAGTDNPKKKSRLLLFDAANGRELKVFEVSDKVVGAVALHPTKDQFASVDYDDRLMLWSKDSVKPTAVVQLDRSKFPIALAYGSESEIVSTDAKGGLVFLDAADGKEIRRIPGHAKAIRSLAVSRDGAMLATGSEDTSIKLWDLRTKKEWRHLRGHVVGVTCLAFSPDGKRLASVSIDRTLRLWDIELGEEILSLPSRDLPFTSVAFDEDGDHIATCAYGVNWRSRETEVSEIRLWSAPRKK